MRKIFSIFIALCLVASLCGGVLLPVSTAKAATAWYVATSGSDSNAGTSLGTAFLTIGKAIGVADDGDTINVAAGTYTEVGQIVISKDLTIIGAGMGQTIIKPAQDTASGYWSDSDAWFLIQAGKTFNLSNVTLDGTGRIIYNGILAHGSGTIDHVAFVSINGGTMNGGAIVPYDGTVASMMTISNCTFSDIGYAGILAWRYATLTITGNTYTGKGAGADYVDYGIMLKDGVTAAIDHNTISNCLGTGSLSAGIVVTTPSGVPTHATITHNTITANSIGIGVSHIANDPSVVTAQYNDLSGNNYGVEASTVEPLVATYNWWGVTTPLAISDLISGDVTYAPWLLTPDGIASDAIPVTATAINGTAAASPSTVAYDGSSTITFAPTAGYYLAGLTVNGSPVSPLPTDNTYVISNIVAATTVVVTFEPSVLSLTYIAGPNGTIAGTASQTVALGASGTAVVAVPTPGYRFVIWSDGSTANPRIDTNVTANLAVTASFVPDVVDTFTLTYAAGMYGTISGAASQTVAASGSGTAVTAVPTSGYRFLNWSDGSTVNPRTDINVMANVTVTASFTPRTVPSPSSLLVVLTVESNIARINGMPVTMDAAPVIRNSRTILPIRALMETLGGSTSWNAAARTATVKLAGRTVVLTIGKNTALVNGVRVTIDPSNPKVIPEIISGRTYLPLRFIAENLGLDLAWDAPSQTISFTYWP